MAANQNAQSLNRGLSSNFWWLRSANHVKCTEEGVMCTEKNILVKNVYKWAKYGFATASVGQQESSWNENTLSFK